MAFNFWVVAWTIIGIRFGSLALWGLYNAFFHPLAKFPGPRAAGITQWWKTYIEVVQQESMVHLLVKLHKKYGDIVRVAPNELHFANPEAYHYIYNASLRWDKEAKLYESFGEDHSSFGLVRYADAKQRKDVLQPLFSRRSILNSQALVREKVNHLVEVLSRNDVVGESSDMLFAFRSFTVDMITAFCFAKSVDAMDAPEFAAPIVVAMDNSLPAYHLFHHFPLLRKTIFSLPPSLAIQASPETAGLTRLQVILAEQVKTVSANPSILESSAYPTIYHKLLDKKVHKSNHLFTKTALLEEAVTMLFAGGVTVGDTSMTGFFHILDNPDLYSALRKEVTQVWPNINRPIPSLEVLEGLPLLTATIKESLRISPGACSPLLRIVPAAGATISGTFIPGGTIVGMSSYFVHQSAIIFKEPEKFKPSRWLNDEKDLEKWLVAFSKGPRSCLGLNLAWCELYLLYATLLRKFEMSLDGTTAADLAWRDCFTPFYPGRHLRIFCKPVNKK